MTFRLHEGLFTCALARDLYEIETRWRDPEFGIFDIQYLASCFASKMESRKFNTDQIKDYMDPQVLLENNPFVLDDKLQQPTFKHCLRCGEDKYPNFSDQDWTDSMNTHPVISISPGYCEQCTIVRRTVRELNFKITQNDD
uniref:Uncharacterized protein n=1 Tax=Clandestinovirus TaxID=2831644 RepID=A0A8F8KLT8_9VIRU|nr:hypothetical protein KOM_12_223 [Clandestinovirus]